MYLLDTDVLIDIQRGHAPAIVSPGNNHLKNEAELLDYDQLEW